MTFERTTETRRWIGRAAAVFCALFVLAAMDGLVSIFRKPVNELHMLPGETSRIDGSLGENVKGVEELSWIADSPAVELQFESVHSGFWMGGLMWRGDLTVDPGIAPGKYSLVVTLKNKPWAKAQAGFLILVFTGEKELNAASRSFLLSRLGLNPWHVAVFFLVLIALDVGCVYLLSRKRETILMARGIAEIYHITESAAGVEIYFSMGSRLGMTPGTRMEILNEETLPVGEATVSKVNEKDAMALVGEGARPKPGFLVRRMS